MRYRLGLCHGLYRLSIDLSGDTDNKETNNFVYVKPHLYTGLQFVSQRMHVDLRNINSNPVVAGAIQCSLLNIDVFLLIRLEKLLYNHGSGESDADLPARSDVE